MARKLTALFLFCLMMVASATSQGGLHYCLCLHTVFVGDCDCEELVESGLCSQLDTKAVTSKDSCRGEKEDMTPEFYPDDPCSTDLTIAMDDFVVPVIPGMNVDACIAFISPPSEVEIPTPAFRSSVNGTRGPPLCKVVSTVPLFLRHSVFLV